MDKVSIVIPCYRQAHFLAEAIESVLAQSHSHYEIIVVDDGSPDHPSDVVAHYPAVRYIRQENGGTSAARNTGIRESRGNYIVFLDADDRLLPHHLETNVRAFTEYPDVAFVCGDYRWFGAEGTWHVHDCRPMPDHYSSLLRANFIGPPHVVMFSRQILVQNGGFNEDFKTCEDQELYMRLARRYRIYCHHEVIAEYRRHDAQFSRNAELMLRTSRAVMRLQKPYIRGVGIYEEAFRVGMRLRQRMYGEALIWQVYREINAHLWHQGLQGLLVLWRYYPRGIWSRVCQKMWNFVNRSSNYGQGERVKKR